MNSRLQQLGLQGLSGRFIGASDREIADFEKQVGFRLPESYKAFLSQFGAAIFGQNVGIQSMDPSPWAVGGVEAFDIFYGISETPHSDVRRVNHRLRNSIPETTLAIGNDPGSNLILISTAGEVLFFERDSAKLFKLANDFDGFLNSFVSRVPK